eukprot:TRINITY_DN6710_c0_g1_i3.p1 TRINITY_DN6710_c0_g1~~TRINITY_DN6710_c0_g1_i3.p1  ORF type:complete len:239 (+),score=20.57 TRINITY_DN6710_c0_g1_i3:73-789(+)
MGETYGQDESQGVSVSRCGVVRPVGAGRRSGLLVVQQPRLRCRESARSPQNGRRLVIKRIVGVEGDLLRIPDYDNRIFVVPLGHVWVEGDNADNSNDSRFYGPVPVASLHGKATRIVWPPSRWATLHKQYPDINRFVGRDAVAEIAEDEFIEYPWAQARIERRRKAMESPPSPNDTHPAFIDEYDDDPPWVKRHRWKRTSGKLNWQQVREGGDGGDGVRVRGERSPPAPAVAEVEKER